MSETAENMTQFTDEVEENEIEETEAIPEEIVEAFKTSSEKHDIKKDEEKVLLDVFNVAIPMGISFAQVRKYFKELKLDFGFDISGEDKVAILENAFIGADVSNEEGFNSVVAQVNNAIESTSERGAGQMVRAYARKLGLNCFKKPQPEVTGTRVAFVNDFYTALTENPQMTKEEVHQYIVDNGSEGTLKSEGQYQKVRVLCNNIAAKYVS